MRKAFLTGVTGQTASYLAELLIKEGYDVSAMVRRGSTITTERINHLLYPKEKIKLFYGDLADTNSIYKLLMETEPDEIYNIGSMSHVRVSFDIPEYTFDVTGGGVIRLLEAIKNLSKKEILKKDVKFLQASSSEMFGLSPPPQNENTPMIPVSPYGVSKLAGYNFVRLYRFGYKMFCANSICFNHESPRRGRTFVTQKIVHDAVKIKLGKEDKIKLGNLDAKRDWGHAKDYAYAQFMIMQHETPDDFVVSTGDNYSVKEFLEKVFKKLNLDIDEHLEIVDQYRRPNEVPNLLGDSTKIRKTLGWKETVHIDELIDEMITSAMEEEKNGNITTA